MRSAQQSLVRTAVLSVFCLASACSYAQVTTPPTNLGLNTPLPRVSDTTRQPADTALESPKVPDPTDRSVESSPVSPERTGLSLAPNTTLSIQIPDGINSGAVRNGDTLQGILTGPVRTSAGTTLAAGTKVTGTVVSAAKAGTVASAGVLSLQLTAVGHIPIVTDVLDFNGQEGHKDVADAAPQKGTEAAVAPNTTLQFKVLRSGPVPGLVKGVSVEQLNGGPTVGSGGGAQQQQPAGSTGTPNTGPGVNQTPVNGATQGVTPKR